MRLAPAAALALAIVAAPLAAASAGVLSSPPQPADTAIPTIAPGFRTIADVEMTVSNSYGYANLRAKPSTSGKLLDKLPQGTKVTVIEKVAGGSWAHVRVGAKEGYIQAKLLK